MENKNSTKDPVFDMQKLDEMADYNGSTLPRMESKELEEFIDETFFCKAIRRNIEKINIHRGCVGIIAIFD